MLTSRPPAATVKVAKEEKKPTTRKGKWTIEEEEFTTRIIEYFNSGLLELPEGTTLRSYLADKLNCDPMRITKKFSGASCLGKRVFHASVGRQRDERLSRCASQQTLAAAHRELASLEARFVDAVSRSNESKDARMIDLEARFLHSSNVVSTPAIDAFIMQSCGGGLWDPDGVVSQSSKGGSAGASRPNAGGDPASHLYIDPSAYANSAAAAATAERVGRSAALVAAARRYEEEGGAASANPHSSLNDFPLNQTIHEEQGEDDENVYHKQQRHHYPPRASSEQQYSVDPYHHHHHYLAQQQQQQQQHQVDPHSHYYHHHHQQQQQQDQFRHGHHSVPPPMPAPPTQAGSRFQHLVQQHHDPNFEMASRASQSQHKADKQRVDRWISSHNTTGKVQFSSSASAALASDPRPSYGGSGGDRDLTPSTGAKNVGGEVRRQHSPQAMTDPSLIDDSEGSPPSHHRPPTSPCEYDDGRQRSSASNWPHAGFTVTSGDSEPSSQPPKRSDDKGGVENVTNKSVSKDTSEASGLLLGFVKSLQRSESHNDLVDFVEDVNEKAAKRSAAAAAGSNGGGAYRSPDENNRCKRQVISLPAQ